MRCSYNGFNQDEITVSVILTRNNQKQPGDFDEILLSKARLEKYLKEKCYSKQYQQYSFNYFSTSFLILGLSSKVSFVQTTISIQTIKHKWVNSLSPDNHLRTTAMTHYPAEALDPATLQRDTAAAGP